MSQSCRSRGYRIAKTKSECEDVAQQLGLSDTSATTNDWNAYNCSGQQFYRCSYLNELIWSPNCGDNENDDSKITNLCISGM